MSSLIKKDEGKGSPLPYMFVLKEGPEFEKNLFDYSLCMMQIRSETYNSTSSKIVVSPKNMFDARIGIKQL